MVARVRRVGSRIGTANELCICRLAVAGEDLNLRLLKKDFEDDDENIFIFGGGLSGHRKKVNELTWCGGFGEESFRFLASVSGRYRHNYPL